jgi:tetratricopeptide (TPR) repeat protein
LATACGPPGSSELRQGERDIQAGQFAEAIVVLNDATRILAGAPHPVQAKAWNLLGLACQNYGQLDAADNSYRQALKFDHDNAAIDFNLGCLRCQQSNYPGAMDYLTTYIQLRPKDSQGFLRLGSAHFHYALERPAAEKGKYLEAARRDFEAAEAASPSAESANDLGVILLQHRAPGAEAVREAAANFDLALHRDPSYLPALFNRAIVAEQYQYNHGQALQLFRVYLKANPPPPHAREVGILVKELDSTQRISITPSASPTPAPPPRTAPPPARMNIAPSNAPPAAAKPPPASAPVAQASIPSNTPAPPPQPPPQSPPPVTGATSTPPAAAQVPAAPPSTVSNPPGVPEPVVTETTPWTKPALGQRLNPLHWFSGKGKTNEQDSAGEPPPVPPGTRYEYPPPVTTIPGDRARAKLLMAEAVRARQAHDFIQSLRDYQDAIDADPTFYDASFEFGLAAIEDREYPTALQALHRALTLQEDSAEARYAFAWTLQKRGYNEDAALELEKLLSHHSADVRAHLLLGNLYSEKLHQPRLAREHFIMALQLDPSNTQAPNIRAWLQQQKP